MTKFNITLDQLKQAEHRVYSQGNQDGIIEAIFNQIGEGNKRCCEFGARDGIELSNTKLLEDKGWKRFLFDVAPLSKNVIKEKITPDNINEVFCFYSVTDLDFLSIDVDGNDLYLFQALKELPRVICIEYNSKFRYDESYSIAKDNNHVWQGDDYYGASIAALNKIAEQKGYTLVYKVEQLDAIFVRNDLISPNYKKPSLKELHPEPIIAHEKVSSKEWVKI